MKKILLYTLLLLCQLGHAETYYVSSLNGNNTNTGLSPAQAWLNTTPVEALTLQPGDSVLFETGSCYREIFSIDQSGTAGSYIFFGKYGTGANPIFVGSEKAETWTATGVTNVWQCATSLTNLSGEYYPGRLFFMIGDTIAYGNYIAYDDLTELTAEYDYTANGTTHYVYSTVDPDNAYDSIEVTQRETCVNFDFNNYLEFNGIDVKFSQRQGYFEGYPAPRGTTGLIFRNLTVGYIGGKGSGSAYGITAFYGNMLIENCTFSDCGRRAISINTYTDNADGRKIENIIIRNNTFKRGYHTTSLDLSTMNRTGDTVMNVYFYNNIVDDHERISDNPTSNQLFTQGGINTSRMSNIYIVGNIFIQSTAATLNLENSIAHHVWNNTIIALNPVKSTNPYGTISMNGIDTMDLRNNILYDNIPNNALENNLVHGYPTPDIFFEHRDYNLYYSLFPKTDRCFTSVNVGGSRTYWTTLQWSAFKSAFPTWEVHSPAPTNPDFVNYAGYDFSLTDSSAAKGSGVFPGWVVVTDPDGNNDTINKTDAVGNDYNILDWDLGAYAYVPPVRYSNNDHIRATYSSEGTTANATDGDFDTYCQGYDTDAWFILALDDTITLDNIAIAYYTGSRQYKLSIQVSLDSTNWTTVKEDTTRGLNNHFESFFFEQTQASYIRINGLGYIGGLYNLWGEIYLPPLRSTISSAVQSDSSFRILFIGNSYTAYGPVPYIFQDIAASHGWPAPYVKYTYISGESLATHRASATTASFVNEGGWDYVVLQDASRRTFSDTVQMYLDITWFYDTIKVTSPEAIVTLYSTWATLEPYATNNTMWTNRDQDLFDDWRTMQDGITHDYHRAALEIVENATFADKNDTLIAYVGEKWRAHINGDTLFRLQPGADNHANDTGRYLNALAIYDAIYGVDVRGSGYWKTSEYAATHLQNIVEGSGEEEEPAPELESGTDIVTFTIAGQTSSSVNATNHTVTVNMPYGTNVASLSPTITVSESATINPLSGVARNFATPQTYSVTAEDLTEQVWTVTVNVAAQTTNKMVKMNGKFVKYQGKFIVINL